MPEFLREHLRPLAGAAGLHLLLLGLLGLAALQWTSSQPPVQLAIEAVVVDARDFAAATASRAVKPVVKPAPQPEPPPQPQVEPEPQPEPVRAVEKPVEKPVEPVREEPDRRAEQRKADAARKQQALREEQQAKEAEARDARLQAQREAELRRQLAAEEAEMEAAAAVARSGVVDEYRLLLVQTIERNWNRPPSARAGLECTLFVTQATGGTVVDVKLGSCNGDEAVRQSIVNAVYRSSPLPSPSDPRAFQRKLEIVFKPTE